MTDERSGYGARAAELNARFRGLVHNGEGYVWPAPTHTSLAEIPADALEAHVTRAKTSRGGISKHVQLQRLVAGAVDQLCLDEICELGELRRLELDYPVTATSLSALRRLTKLQFLSLHSPRNVVNFAPLLELPALTTLIIRNAKQMQDISWLSDAHHLEVIGVEGGMYTTQRIPTLKPLEGLKSMKAFYATSVRLTDKSLMSLAECPALEYIGCARFAPREEFERLHAARSDIVCTWFRPEAWDSQIPAY